MEKMDTIISEKELAQLKAQNAAMAKTLGDINLVLTAIALLQTDKTLHVPIDAIKSVKQGTQLEIKFDTLLDQYVIEAVEPQEEKETVIHADPPKKVYPY